MSNLDRFTDNLARLDRAGRLLRIQREARENGAELTLGQAASVLRIYERWIQDADGTEPPPVPFRRVVAVDSRELREGS